MRSDHVPVAELREAVLASGMPLSTICCQMGWLCTKRKRPTPGGDTARLKRTLGLLPNCTRGRTGKRYATTMDTINYHTAVRIAAAAGLDPVDVGL